MPPLWPALLAVLTAAGPQEKIAVIEVEAPDMMMGLGGQVTRAVLEEAKVQHLDVIEPDAVRASIGEKNYEALRKCAGRPGCVSQYLGPIAGKAVVGSLSRDDKNYLLKLFFIDVAKVSVIADVDRSILIAARRFPRDLAQAIPPLLRGEREARGTLKVNCNLPDAEISVNGELMGAGVINLQLKPGKYEVKVERKKYLPVVRLIGVEANQTTEGTIKLLLKPGEIPDSEVVPPLVVKQEESSSGLRISLRSWLVGGAAVAAMGFAVTFALIEKSEEQKLLDGFNVATSVFAGTRRDALSAQRDATIANVGFGIAAAALAATVVSVIFDFTSAPPLQVAPVATSGGAGFVVGGRF